MLTTIMCNLYHHVMSFYIQTKQRFPSLPTAIPTARRAELMHYLIGEITEFGRAADIAEQVDAAADMLFFVMDIFVELGVNPEVPMEFVINANMQKVWEDGSVMWDHSVVPARLLKPDGWQAPNDKIARYIANEIAHNSNMIRTLCANDGDVVGDACNG